VTTPAVEPTFSIITVCYNAGRTIRRTIESVAHQTFERDCVEHLVIDGASTDDTLDVLAQYEHLRVVSERDAGLYDAMNKGIGLARGTYVAMLNADDWYEPDALAVVAAAFREMPRATYVHGDVRRWRHGAPVDVVKPLLADDDRDPLCLPVNHPASFVHRDVFRRFGTFDLAYPRCADYDWVKRVLVGGAVLHYCPHVLTNFGMGGVSTRRFLIRERYRVRRAHGAGVVSACRWVARTAVVVLKNRWSGADR
jgi:glycosyltransferase involved in cell wall biosynthesis